MTTQPFQPRLTLAACGCQIGVSEGLSAGGHPVKVCVIDDDALMLTRLEEMLADLGCEVVSAADVDAALRLMESQHCDAAVVDILMPDRDGLNFIMDVRRTRADLWIVAISGGGRLGAGDLLSMARGLGADAALVKPFSTSDLGTALRVGEADRARA